MWLTYLQMEFESWEVSSTLRDLVRQENVKYELSLLAMQEEKVGISNQDRLDLEQPLLTVFVVAKGG